MAGTMFLISLGTAVPPRRYAQRECWEALRDSIQFRRLSLRSRAILRKVLLGENGIGSRHLALDPLSEAFQLDPDALHARFLRHAPAMGTAAGAEAIAAAGIPRDGIDAVVVSTCTGYLCPGLTSYLVERLALRSDVVALDLVGQGCGAALPCLRTADALLASGQADKVLCICVEVCSAAFYLDDDPGVLISACLFGDGAGAVVLSSQPRPGRRRIEWKATGSLLAVEDRDYLRFEQRHGMLRNILARQVPSLAAKHAETVLTQVLAGSSRRREEITGWMLHAGGRDVLVALEERLRLSAGDTRWSAAVLHGYGNLSSPFALFVLKAALDGQAPGGTWWLASFGAGFSSHGALLEVE